VNIAKGPLRAIYDALSAPWAARLSDKFFRYGFALSIARRGNLTKRGEPLVTIVIPVYNVVDYIANCLFSVAAQDYPNIKVLMVDDGSTDASPAVAVEVSKVLNLDCEVVSQKNAGLAAARNAGVKAIDTTDYLMFLDSDDMLPVDAVSSMVRSLQSSGSDFVVGDVVRLKGLTRVKRVDTRAVYTGGSRKAITFKDHPAVIRDVTAWNKLFKFDFYKSAKLKFPDGLFFEDMAIMTEAYIRAAKFDVLASKVYYWRVRTEGSKSITQQTGDDVKFADRMTALKAMRASIHAAIKAGKATQANMDAFADRLRTHDAKLHADRADEIVKLAE